jgi:hypothetical protein
MRELATKSQTTEPGSKDKNVFAFSFHTLKTNSLENHGNRQPIKTSSFCHHRLAIIILPP